MTDKRTFYRKNLSSLYLPYYDSLCGLLPLEWQPYSGMRSFDEQQAIYNKGRSAPGEIVTRAVPGQSPHNYGCATDWCLWSPDGTPFWPDRLSFQWQPYLNAIEKVGLRSGYSFGDAPHNELLITCAWSHVALVYSQGGMTAAQQKIECNLPHLR
jgi:hypothetical protein